MQDWTYTLTAALTLTPFLDVNGDVDVDYTVDLDLDASSESSPDPVCQGATSTMVSTSTLPSLPSMSTTPVNVHVNDHVAVEEI